MIQKSKQIRKLDLYRQFFLSNFKMYVHSHKKTRLLSYRLIEIWKFNIWHQYCKLWSYCHIATSKQSFTPAGCPLFYKCLPHVAFTDTCYSLHRCLCRIAGFIWIIWNWIFKYLFRKKMWDQSTRCYFSPLRVDVAFDVCCFFVYEIYVSSRRRWNKFKNLFTI